MQIESLEARRLLVGDLAGDDLLSAQAVSLTPGVQSEINAAIGLGTYSAADVDLFQVNLVAGDQLSVDIDAALLDDGTSLSNLDSYVRIFDSTGAELALNNDGFSPNDFYFSADSFLTFNALIDDSYYVGVTSQGNTWYDPNFPGSAVAGATTGAYRLQLLVGAAGGGPNQAPTAVADAFAATQDTALTVPVATGVLANDTDPENDTLAAAQPVGPSSGSLNLSANGSFTYTPNAGFTGTDSFTYVANDGANNSAAATVTITVSAPPPPSNQAPVAVDDSYLVVKDTLLKVGAPGALLNDSDADNDPLTLVVQGMPSNGTLYNLNVDGSFDYLPNPGFTGFDSFSYVANDGVDNSAAAVVNIEVRAPIIVTTDLEGATGLTSLRGAIGIANTNPGPDFIRFSLADAQRTITLAQGELLVNSDIDIAGPTDGSALTISGGGSGRVLTVSSGDVRVSNMMLDGGSLATGDGGGVWNGGNLTLENVTIANSSASGGDGGGIFNAFGGSLALIGSTISGNTASGAGGGVYNAGAVDFFSTTITANTAILSGAGVSNSATANLQNTLVAGNSGAADVSGAFVSQGNNLIGDATGGTGFNTNLNDQLGGVSGNPTIDPLLGPLQDNGGAAWTHLLLPGSPATDAGGSSNLSATDQRGAPRVLDGIDPGDASDNIATADIGAVEFGSFFVNVQGDALDATTLGDGVVDSDASSPGAQVSLRGAVQELEALANWSSGAGAVSEVFEGAILFAASAQISLLTLQGANENNSVTGDLDIHGNLTIRGASAGQTVIDAGGFEYNADPNNPQPELSDRVFHVQPGGKLRLEQLTVMGGHAVDDGAVDAGLGGGVFNDGGVLEIADAKIGVQGLPSIAFGLNEADRDGGGVYSRNGSVAVFSGGAVDGNLAANGAGIYLESGIVTLASGSFVRENVARSSGGGVYMNDGQLLLTGAEVSGNELLGVDPGDGTPRASGAGLSVVGGVASISQSSAIVRNFTQGISTASAAGGPIVNGGGIFNASVVSIEDSLVAFNGDGYESTTVSSRTYGGGIYNTGSLTVTDSNIDDNDGASGYGGGVYNTATGVVTVEGGSISRNALSNVALTQEGGGIYNDGGVVEIRGTRLEDHILALGDARGGAIHNNGGDVTLVGAVIANNQTYGWGGGVYNFGLDARLTLIDTTLESNTSIFGGGVSNQYGSVDIQSTSFIGNTSTYPGTTPAERIGGGGVFNAGTNRFIASTPATLVVLDAAVNGGQLVLFVDDVSPFASIPLPTGILVEDERMTVTAIDEFTRALIVERTAGVAHPVASEVRTYINETQTSLVVGDPTEFQSLALPLDIVITTETTTPAGVVAASEVMTVAAVNGDVLTVLRGRNGTTPIEHTYPLDVWGVGGALTISNSTFAGNVAVNETLLTDPDNPLWGKQRGGGLLNIVHPFVRPTSIENTTFTRNSADLGSGVWTSFDPRYERSTNPAFDLSAPNMPELPAWPINATTSVFMQNTVVTEGYRPDGAELDDISVDAPNISVDASITLPGNIASGGSNFIGVDETIVIPLEIPISLPDTAFLVVAPNEKLPSAPFLIQVQYVPSAVHVRDIRTVREEMLVTNVSTDGDFLRFDVLRAQGGTEQVPHPEGASVMVSKSGFWQPSDRFGSLPDVLVPFATIVNASGGFTALDTKFDVADASNLPNPPFQIDVSFDVFGQASSESMWVTDRVGTELTVTRGYAGTTAIAISDMADVTFSYPFSQRLDPMLDAPRAGGGVTDTSTPLAGSPLLDAGSEVGFVGMSAVAVTALAATYELETPLYMSVDPAAVNTQLAAFAFADDTILSVADASNFPTAPFLLRIADELMNVTAVDTTGNLLTVERAQNGTSSVEYNGGEALLFGQPVSAATSETTLNVASVAGLPATPFIFQAGAELLRVTSVNALSNLLTVERAAYGTLAQTQAVGATLRHGALVEVADVSNMPPAPFLLKMGNELMRVLAVDPTWNTVAVDRGVLRSGPASHLPGALMLHADAGLTQTLPARTSPGFQGRDVLLAAAVSSATATQLTVEKPVETLVSPFDIRIGNEELQVTGVVEQSDGTLTLTVVRGVNGTTAAASYAAGSNVLILRDQRGVSRFLDAEIIGQRTIDIGAAEGIVFVVNSTADLPDLTPGNGVVDTATVGAVSLRAAIMEANALGASATISLPAGNYSTTSSLDISGAITIIGQGAATTTVSGSADRVFEVLPNASFGLAGVKVSGGVIAGDGGGILVNQASFWADAVQFSGNAATRGGAVANNGGDIVITNSTLSGNSSTSDGGAVVNIDGQLVIANSTLSTNAAQGRGGAVINLASGALTISSSTVSLNSADKTGGLYNEGALDISNTIVASNTTISGEPDAFGRFSSLGYNLVGIRPTTATSLNAALDQTTLTAAEVDITVVDAAGLPTAPFSIFVGGAEEMLVTQVVGNVLTALRHQGGTTAVTHAAGATVRLDGFWKTADQTGDAGSPLNPFLGPLLPRDGSLPVHEATFMSSAINAGGEQIFRGRNSTLGLAVRAEDASVVITDNTALPETPFLIRVDSEVMRVTSVAGGKLTVKRNINGSVLLAHARGAVVSILTDQRGAGRPTVDDGMPATQDKVIDVGAFERASELSIQAITPSLSEAGADATGTLAYTFRVTRSGKTSGVTPFNYYVIPSGDRPASLGDFAPNQALSGTPIFAADQTYLDLVFNISADSNIEHDETFQVIISALTYDAVVTTAAATAEIRNDDAANVSISDASAVEGLGLVFNVSLDVNVEGGFTLPWSTSDGTAQTANLDYTAASGELRFRGDAGESYPVIVRTSYDTLVERDETLQVQLGALLGAAPAADVTVASFGTGTLINDDATALVINGVRLIEGDNGTKNASVEVSLSPNSVDTSFSVKANLTDGTALAGADYTSTAPVLNFSGNTGEVVTFVVPIVGDLSVENDESFNVGLANLLASGRETSISLGADAVTILNDDAPSIFVSDVTLKELTSGESTFSFDVVLADPLGGPVSVDVATVARTASAGTDFVSKTETLVFSGVDGETLTFNVQVKGDQLVELTESFDIRLSNLQAGGNEASFTLVDGVGAIINDDVATLSIVASTGQNCNDPQVLLCQSESAGGFAFSVVLTGAVDVPVSVTADVVDETTTVGVDYAATSRTLLFSGAAGQNIVYPVATTNDSLPEFDETFTVTLADVVSSGRDVVLGAAAVGQILDDDLVNPPHPVPCVIRPPGDNGQSATIDLSQVDRASYPLTLDLNYWYVMGYQVAGLAAANPDWGLDPANDVVINESGFSFDADGNLLDQFGNSYGPGFSLNGGALSYDTYAPPFGDIQDIQDLLSENGGPFNWGAPTITSPPSGGWPDAPPPVVYCEAAPPPPNPPTPPADLPPEPVSADWVVSLNESLTFNPFPSFDYRRAEDVALTIDGGGGYTNIGDTVALTYGSVTVNADFTLTYTPNPNLDLTLLSPEFDANGNAFRYIALESFEAHVIDAASVAPNGASGESAPTVYASTPVELAVSNNLPTIRGERIHGASAAAGTYSLDSPIFVDAVPNSSNAKFSYRVDIRDLFQDLDGQSDLDKLSIVDIAYGARSLDEDDPSNNAGLSPPADANNEDPDRDPVEIRIAIGAKQQSVNGFWQDTTIRDLVVRKTGASTFEIQNTVEVADLSGAWNDNYSSQVGLVVTVTDGQPDKTKPITDAAGVITGYETLTWDVYVDVRPRNQSTYATNWEVLSAAPEVDFRPWVAVVTPSLIERYPNAIGPDLEPASDPNAWQLEIAQPDAAVNFENVGGVDVDVRTGEFLRRHDLVLDGSGGASEMALPGLVYDSSVVQVNAQDASSASDKSMPVVQALLKGVALGAGGAISATLEWFNANGPVLTQWSASDVTLTEQLITLSPPSIDNFTSVFGWELTVNITDGADTITLRSAGETPVVVGDQKAIFGAGWALAGVPAISLDQRDEDDASAARRTWDDRIILAFPGEAPKIFNAKNLTLNNYSFAGQLNSLQPGSTEVSNDGFANLQEFGVLTARQNPDELVYNDGTGREYVFKQFTNDNGTPTDTTDDTTSYLIDRIEQPGVQYDTATNAWPAGRRGISFEWNTNWDPAQTNEQSLLKAIVATDGARTLFGYDASGYLESQTLVDSADQPITLADGTTLARQVNFKVENRKLTEIRQVEGSNKRLRVFNYANGLMTKDQWYSDEPANAAPIRQTDFTYTSGLLSQIQLGDGTAGANTILYDVAPAQAGNTLVGAVSVNATDLAKYDETTKAAAPSAGVYKTDYNFSLNGQLERRRQLFNSVELSRETWRYDPVGFVKRYTDPLGRQTAYWYDYETPTTYKTNAEDLGTPTAPQLDPEPKYDPDDYRGNVTFVVSPAGLTRFEYETDDETGDALGRLVKKIELPNIQSKKTPLTGASVKGVVTEYTRADDGQLETQLTIRGTDDRNWSGALPIPVEQTDPKASWTYLADGLLQSSTDARGLTTTYAYNAKRQLDTTTVVDSGPYAETRTTKYSYDVLGFLDRETLYAGDAAGPIISVQNYAYDTFGFLRQVETLAADNTTVLTRQKYEYAPDGVVTAVIDGNNVRSETTYDAAGLLTKTVAAVGETYYALYTGQQESVEQTTTYQYYANGALQQKTLLDGTLENYYADAATRTAWSVTSGVSAGEHTVDAATGAISFNLAGVQVTKTQTDVLGRQTLGVNLLTGALVNTDRTPSGGAVTTKQTIGPPAAQRSSTRKQDVAGNLLHGESGGPHTQIQRDALGRVEEIATDGPAAAKRVAAKLKTDAAGDVVQQTEERGMPNGGGWLTQYFTTQFVYDQQGRRRKTIDPLTDGNSSWTDELNAAPAKTDYTFDAANSLSKVTATARSGVATHQWYDAAGRLVQEQNAAGALTTYAYDLAGNLTSQTFTPKSGDARPPLTTTFQVDSLGRVRAAITNSPAPSFVQSFVATDYFNNNAANADGWNVASFIPLPGAGPAGYPYDASTVKNLASRARFDSLGNTYYAQSADPDGATAGGDDNTPTTLITYSYLPAADATVVTTRLSSGANVGLNSPPNIDRTAPEARVSRQVSNTKGEVILNAQRLTDFTQPDALAAMLTGANEYDLYLDAGFELLQYNTYQTATGRLQTSIDSRAAAPASYTYTPEGRVETIVAPGGGVTSFVYDTAGNLLQETKYLNTADAKGISVRYEYDALGRRTRVRDALRNETVYVYQNGGDFVETHDARGFITVTMTDPVAGTQTLLYPEGVTQITEFDSAGNAVKLTDPQNLVTTTFVYDALNRQTKATTFPGASAPAGLATVTAYDISGNVLSVTDPLNNAATFAYDALGRQTSVTDDLNGVTKYAYDVSGNRKTLLDSVGNTTTWTYDGLNRVAAETNALGFSRGFQYDASGNLFQTTDRNGRVIEYEYDAGRRRTKEKWLDASAAVVHTITTNYNGARLTSVSDIYSTYAYKYDAIGRIESVDNAGTPVVPQVVLTSSYDAAGNRTGLAAKIGGVDDFKNVYKYDGLNRLDVLTQQGQTGGNAVAAKQIDFDYDAVGRLKTVGRFNAVFDVNTSNGAAYEIATSSFAYDGANRLTNLAYQKGGADLFTPYAWQFDAGGRISQFTSADGTATYGYDDTNQLTSETYVPASGGVVPSDQAFSYDANGNRTNAGYVVDPNNETKSDGVFDYVYDNEGNRTQRTEIATGAVTEYAWDYRNRLTRVTEKDSQGAVTQVVEYTYDVFNRRIEKAVDVTSPFDIQDAALESYIYDDASGISSDAGGNVILDFVDADGPAGPATSTLSTRRLYGNAVDQILAEENVSELITAPSRVLWNLVDNLGTTRDIARNDSTLATHFTYDAFGQVLTGDTTLTRYLYTSREYDPATGLTYNRARWYATSLGQFISEDPTSFAAGDANLRRYVGNNAINATDPSGLEERGPISRQRVNNDGSVSFVNPNIDPEVEALLRKRGSAPVTHIHNFNTGVPVARDLADPKLYPYLLPNSRPPAISGPVLRATIDAGMSEITSRNSERPSLVFSDARKHLIQFDGPWGYRPTGATAPLPYDSRTLAELRIYDQLAIDNYKLAEGVGTFVLHALPGGAASDYFSQEGIASKQAWLAVAADFGAVATLGGSKYIRIIGMTAEGAVIVMSSVDAARNVADGKYMVAAGDFGQIMLHALILRKGVKLHRSSRLSVDPKRGPASKLADNLASRNWPAASLDKAIARHAGDNYTTWVTKTGKRIYENPATGRQIVHDFEGRYFRIFQPNSIGSQKGTYLNMLGNELRPARFGSQGVHSPLLRDVDKGLWQQETHFFIEELLR